MAEPSPGPAEPGTGVKVSVPDGQLTIWERGSGRPVVLVHGGTATAAHDWGPLTQALAQDHRVVSFDHRGHGRSRNSGGDLALRRFAADLPHVLRRLGIGPATFVAFSMGANAVLHLLTREPHHAAAAVLVGGSSTGDPGRVQALAAGASWPGSLRRLRHEIDPAPDYWQRLRTTLLDDWAHNTEIPTSALARILCPILVVHGARDPIQTKQVAEHLAAGLPRARLAVVADAGHAVQLDQPEAFHLLVRTFLDATDPPDQWPSGR